MPDTIEHQIKEMIVEECFLTIEPDAIGNDDDLMETLGLDSVALLQAVVGLEERFGVTFEDTEFDLEVFRNVASIANYVRDVTGQS